MLNISIVSHKLTTLNKVFQFLGSNYIVFYHILMATAVLNVYADLIICYILFILSSIYTLKHYL